MRMLMWRCVMCPGWLQLGINKYERKFGSNEQSREKSIIHWNFGHDKKRNNNEVVRM